MLGRGRPFALELIDPHHTKCDVEEVKHLQNLINSSTKDIAVHHLQLVDKEQLSQLKDGEENKTKCYSALCVLLDGGSVSESEIQLLNQTDLVLMQKTPLRVLHRYIDFVIPNKAILYKSSETNSLLFQASPSR